MLGTKSMFSIAFQFLTDWQTEVVHEPTLSSFASHVHMESHHDLHKKVIDKIAQNNANYEIRIDIRKLFKTVLLKLFYLLTVLIRFKSWRN